MLINFTRPFKILRNIKNNSKRLERNLIIEYIITHQVSTDCSLCGKMLNEKNLICWTCFYELYPLEISFKISPIVNMYIKENIGESDSFKKLLSKLEQSLISKDEMIIIDNMKRKMHKTAIKKYLNFQQQSKINIIYEQLNIMKFQYLSSLKDLDIESALVIKNNMVELIKELKNLRN